MAADDLAETARERERLRAELATALDAARAAEEERGLLVGEVTELRSEREAAKLAQDEWDGLLAEVRAETDLCLQRYAELERRHHDVINSTSWRSVQAALTPYRWLRTRRG